MIYAIIILTLGLFWVLAINTDILRDPDSCSIPDGKNTFSLGRVQLAVWTVIVFCSFVYLMTITDLEAIDLTGDVAILLGISMGTTVVGRSIDKNARSAVIKNRATANGCSKGFLIDILSDASGISVHRFQQVLFTILLIFVFTLTLIENKNFPDIDDQLLLLSAISSGSYLGIKMSEK